MDFIEDQEEEQLEGGVELGPSYDGTHPAPTKVAEALAPAPAPRKSRYRECLKNHAVGIGGHAVDGCGEFIAAGEDGTLESLKCAACSCHRNFHRKETDAASYPFHQQQQLLLTHGGAHFGFRGPHSRYIHVAAQQQRPPLLALPSTSGGGASRDEMEDYYFSPGSGGGSKKRFRTKFTQEQKERMLSLAARLGWRIQKQDEEVVQEFCNEVGITRHVLKVWMHNNKHTLGKKP